METGKRRNPQLASVCQLAAALDLRPAELDELLAAAAGTVEPSAVPVPRQLPAPPGPFVGREDELGRLDAVVRAGSGTAGTVVVSAIAGAGGVGKSWLVLHWAHRNADRLDSTCSRTPTPAINRSAGRLPPRTPPAVDEAATAGRVGD